MNMLNIEEPKEKKVKNGWTNEEKQKLIDLYPTHTNKELEKILNKTDGQIRGMKTKLGLNSKRNIFTNEEKEKIKQFYLNNKESIDLEQFSKELGRQKTSISRYARKIGLTNCNRPLSEKEKEKISKKVKENYNTEIGKLKKIEISNFWKEWHKTHEHPRGMLGKHHSLEYRNEISKRMIDKFNNMTYEEKHNFAMHNVEIRKKNGYSPRLENAYSRTKSGYREDLGQYFRSRWEANIARVLNYYNIKWTFEPKRFYFWGENIQVQSYLPDFYLPEYDIWIEIKGWMDQKSKERLKLFEEQYSNENSKLLLIDEFKYYQLKRELSNLIFWEK